MANIFFKHWFKFTLPIRDIAWFWWGLQRRPSQLLDALHIQDFFSGIRDGTRVRGGVDDAHKSTLLCQLGNIAFRTQRTLETHPKDGSILNDSEANMFWSKSYHHGFEPKL